MISLFSHNCAKQLFPPVEYFIANICPRKQFSLEQFSHINFPFTWLKIYVVFRREFLYLVNDRSILVVYHSKLFIFNCKELFFDIPFD